MYSYLVFIPNNLNMANKKITAIIAPVQVDNQSIIAIRSEAANVAKSAESFTFKTVDDVTQASEVLKNIALSKKLIEFEQSKVIVKLDELKKLEKGRWKPSLDLLDAADKNLRLGILAFRKEEQVKADEAEQKVLIQLSTGKIKNETTAMRKITAIQSGTMGKTVTAGNASAGFRTIKKLSIVDEKKIPRTYLVPDEKAIKAALMSGLTVAGCEFLSEETLTIK
jgi:hypothetical protein